ncbi:hypothetical protein CASFOL_030193 [Castilleja foliolosa]|uniref:Uncharacterized protein n=1 Tax=Castilleja foliolosa TaxID=1961234 RepID=A0ABD3CBA9_9LAMI
MGEVVEISDDDEYSVSSDNLPIVPKDESLDYDFRSQTTCSRPAVVTEENADD